MSIFYDFTDKVVLITGSRSGIGANTAIQFSKLGARVVVTGLAINRLDVSTIAKHCLDVSPNKLKALEVFADISNEDDCKRLIETTIKKFGKLDILVNCAGIASFTHITDTKYLKIYKKTMETNRNSVIYLTHYSLEYLEKTKGNIINISSVDSIISTPMASAYGMSKCAIDMFTLCMTDEFGSKHIRINSIIPGGIRTNMAYNNSIDKNLTEHIYIIAENEYPVGRVGRVDDITNAIMFLSSNDTSFITGTNFIVDGGHIALNFKPSL